MTEAQLSRKVISLAHKKGWTVAHFHRAPTQKGSWSTPVAADGKGFPDLVLTRDRVIFVELKAPKKYPTPAQRAWLDRLRAAGAEVYVWKPEHLLDGTIENFLEYRKKAA